MRWGLKKIQDFARCQNCGEITAYVFGSSTNNLLRHKLKCQPSPTSPSFRHPRATPEVPVSPLAKADFKDALIEFCVGDICPFALTQGPFFQNVIQNAVDIGAQHGRVDACNLIPAASTISRNIKTKAKEARELIRPRLLEAVKNGEFALITDMWTEGMNQYHFLTLSASLLSPDWQLENFVLCTSEFPYESSTAQNIRSGLSVRLEKFGIPEVAIPKIPFTTDGGANVVNALEGCTRLCCIAHSLNVVTSHVFSVRLGEVDLFGCDGSIVIEDVKSLVEFLRSKKLQKHLKDSIPLIQDAAPGRYKSKLPMLNALLDQYQEVSFQQKK